MIVRESATPLYEQVKAWLVGEIRTGALAEHAQVPSERRLVRDLGVSRITVRRALSDLARAGVIYAVPARGFYVGQDREHDLDALRSFSADARAHGAVPGSRILAARLEPAGEAVGRELQVGPAAEVVVLRRVRTLDGVPVLLQEARLPHWCCPGILGRLDDASSLYAVLEEAYGIVLAEGRTTLGARLADAEERDVLRLPEPSAVLSVEQVTWERAGRPVELLRSAHHPGRYPLRILHGAQGPTRAEPATGGP